MYIWWFHSRDLEMKATEAVGLWGLQNGWLRIHFAATPPLCTLASQSPSPSPRSWALCFRVHGTRTPHSLEGGKCRHGRTQWAWASCEPSVSPAHLDFFNSLMNSTRHWLFHCPRSQDHLRSCGPQFTSEGHQAMWSFDNLKINMILNGCDDLFSYFLYYK
jgi:hypothetical protein